jgi:hypothetical protein
MLYLSWLFAGLLILAWTLGVIGVFTVGNGVHLLLLAAIAAVMVTLFHRPRLL